ncbi:hypothetical protein PHLGIDRAFT_130393 [Phlebiopsis gigantea 11061_1 CR5-6]|uniref:Uncharacterized protein n=1 Tax=Phlebiopsis gigantea (strain 11061_1 CR5-6) TaxID=745531 RepID=A0A0C3S4K9_PHLG1|nr:hypothetical protein PHLGIDRAFT_130393 [Phlebiopsis gigantea 11061_1 CR5-6]
MAALYLHHALFASETPAPPPLSRPSNGLQHQLSLSSVTVRTSTSEHSHPTEPLLHGPYPQAAAYQDILASQPIYSETSRTSWTTGLSLTGNPVTSRERKRQWERQVRRKLRRLRWAKRVLRGVIAVWAVYNTIRYFIAFSIYTARDRQIALLVLGSAAALSFALLVSSLLLSLLAPHLGWKYRFRSGYTRIQALLSYMASFLLLGPAVVNVVFIALWRDSSDPGLSIHGRCHWDIDVLWTGTGFECDVNDAVPWGSWLAGSVIRLFLTAGVIIASHAVSYSYLVTRMPSRRLSGRTHSHSVSYNSAAGVLSTHSSRSLVTMASTVTSPVSAHPIVGQVSYGSDSDFTHESGFSAASSSRPRKLRRSKSRVSAKRMSSDGQPRLVRPPGTDRSQVSAGSEPPALRFAGDTEAVSEGSPGGSHFPQQDGRSSRYGMLTGAGSSTSPSGASPALATPHVAEHSRPHAPVQEVQDFAERFRALVEQVSRETEAGLELAGHDPDDDDLSFVFPSSSPEPDTDGTQYVPVMGKIIQRMPTIESLGSREVMSLASGQRGDRSVHTLSRPPTRANTLTMSEAAGSPSVSRSNSLTASIVLASPVEAPSPPGEPAHAHGASWSTAP